MTRTLLCYGCRYDVVEYTNPLFCNCLVLPYVYRYLVQEIYLIEYYTIQNCLILMLKLGTDAVVIFNL